MKTTKQPLLKLRALKRPIKRKIIIIFLILVLFIVSFFLGKEFPLEEIKIEQKKITLNSGVEESGSLQAYFCPQDDCERLMVERLQQAEFSIHCALYDLDLETLKQIFLAKSQQIDGQRNEQIDEQIDIRLVMDNNYLQKFNTSFVKADKYGEMHDKFCVIDQTWLFTGSTNPTNNDAFKNNNNLIITNISTLVQNYEDEFAELWNGTFKSGSAVRTPRIFVGNQTIQNYFCPEDRCADRIVKELETAQVSIYFMTFSFTHDKIANALLLKRADNLTVEGVMETRQVTKDSPFKRFNQNGIRVWKDGNPRTMHHKVFIIDKRVVITGSMNPTNNGNKNNDENVLIIDDQKIAEQFFKEYEKVREEARAADKKEKII